MALTLPTFADVGVVDPRSVGTLPAYPENDALAQGEAKLGEGITKVGGAIEDIAADRQRQKAKLEQANATTDLFIRLTPLHEQIAHETDPAKLAELKSQYDQLLPTAGNAISDPYARKLWEATHAKAIFQAKADADTRNTLLDRNRANAQILGLVDQAVRVGAAADDPQAFENAKLTIKNQLDYAQQYGSLLPTQRYEAEKKAFADLAEGRVDYLANRGRLDEAKALLDQNRTDLGAARAGNLEFKIETRGSGIRVDGVVNDYIGGGAPRGGASSGVERFLDLVQQHESRGRNIMQGVLGPNGGYNPSTGTVTGPSTAQGYFQITNTTWKSFAPDAGVDLSQYPTAMSAPYDVQRQVARTIATTSGTQHWMDYNAALRFAAVGEGFPRSGPISGGAGAQTEQGKPLAVGDSIAAQLIRNTDGVVGKEYGKQAKPDSTATVGANPQQILGAINALPDLGGQDVVLSTGLSNAPDQGQLQTVADQIKALKAKGAGNVTVLGLGTRADVATLNDPLAKVAADNGATFAGPLRKVQSDGIHSSDAKDLLQQAQAIGKAQPIPTGPQAAPAPGQAPAPPNRTGLPLPEEVAPQIMADPRLRNEQERYQAVQRYELRYKQQEATRAQLERIAAQRQQQQLKDAENEIFADVYSGNPKITPQMVANDPRFNVEPTRRESMLKLINDPPGSGVPAAQSYQAAQSIIDRIRAPEGADGRITTKDQIYDQMRLLNRADLEFVLKKFDELASPGEHRFSQRLEKFFSEITPQIDRSGVMPGLPNDAKGKANSYAFRRFVEDQVDAYRKDGKNPDDLINPKKSDYLGAPEALKPYKRSISEALADFTNEMNGGAGTQAFGPASAVDLSKIGSLSEMQAAVKKDPSLRDRAIAISIEKGWIAPPAAPQPALAPPVR
jgi:hypothetical protein